MLEATGDAEVVGEVAVFGELEVLGELEAAGEASVFVVPDVAGELEVVGESVADWVHPNKAPVKLRASRHMRKWLLMLPKLTNLFSTKFGAI